MNISPTMIFNHLLPLIGSKNAWRTNAELARELGDDSPATRDGVAKSVWYLVQKALVIRRHRGGSAGPNEVMAIAAIDTQPKPMRKSPVSRKVGSLTLADVLANHTAARSAQTNVALKSTGCAQTGPSDDSEPIASEAPEEPPVTLADAAPSETHEDPSAVEPQPIPDATAHAFLWGGVDAESNSVERIDWLNAELTQFAELVNRGKLPPPVIEDRTSKLWVLSYLADIVPPVTARWLRAIAQDIERVGSPS